MWQYIVTMNNILKSSSHRYWLAVVIFMSTPLSGLSIDINAPSFPAISQYLHADKAWVQLSITAYLIGFSIFSLFAGSLTDSLGRKKPFIIALSVFILSNFLTPMISNAYQLCTLRFIQGITLACCNVAMRAAVSDLFQGNEFFKVMGYGNMIWSLGPIIAPVIGGYLQKHYGWMAPFYFLGSYAILALVCNLIILPETIREKQPLRVTTALKNYAQMLVHRAYFSGLCCLGFGFSISVLFSIVSPFLIQNKLHYSALQFGNMALLMGLALFLGTMTNRILINIKMDLKVAVCFWLMVAINTVTATVALLIPLNIYNLIIPCFCLIYLVGIVFPNYYAQCIALFPHMAGSANALMASFMIFIPSIIAIIGAALKTDTQQPLALLYLGLSIACLICSYWGRANSLRI